MDLTFDELLELVVSVDPREEEAKKEEERAKRKKKAVQHRVVTRTKKK